MAVDRQRLAEALAYGEQKRRMMESVPTVGNLPPAQPTRRSLRTDLENLSSGIGQGIVNQMEGVKGLITDPVGTVKGAYEGVKGIVRDPSVLADALRYTADKAMSGPLGAGEVVGEMLGPMRGKPPMAEIDVYHGSPHRFEEFDASKIGTGEGAQAFGHGIYLAESPNVAGIYKNSNRALDTQSLQNVPNLTPKEHSRLGELTMRERTNQSLTPAEIAELRQLESKQDQLVQQVNAIRQQAGSLYKADLPDEMVDRMLDWDKPLSEQRELATPILKELGYLRPNDDGPRQFAQAVKALDMEYGGFGESGANGMALFKAIYRGLEQGKPKVIDFAKRMNLGDQAMFMEASPLASEVMKRMGIPGIRYLDAGSRGQGGTGTRNFVVFPGEEKKVKILERNGEKLAAALQSRPDEVMAQQYRISHRPMTEAGGASRLHEAYKSFGEEIYGKNALQFFGGGDPREAKIPKLLAKLRDNPDAELTIYRGVPKDAGDGINVGDWVTLDRNVAVDYGDKVIAKKVKAKDVTTWSDSLLEFGYYPSK